MCISLPYFPSPTLGAICATDIRLVLINEKNLLQYMQSSFEDLMIELNSKLIPDVIIFTISIYGNNNANQALFHLRIFKKKFVIHKENGWIRRLKCPFEEWIETEKLKYH